MKPGAVDRNQIPIHPRDEGRDCGTKTKRVKNWPTPPQLLPEATHGWGVATLDAPNQPPMFVSNGGGLRPWTMRTSRPVVATKRRQETAVLV
jgi:hypothetical protein